MFRLRRRNGGSRKRRVDIRATLALRHPSRLRVAGGVADPVAQHRHHNTLRKSDLHAIPEESVVDPGARCRGRERPGRRHRVFGPAGVPPSHLPAGSLPSKSSCPGRESGTPGGRRASPVGPACGVRRRRCPASRHRCRGGAQPQIPPAPASGWSTRPMVYSVSPGDPNRVPQGRNESPIQQPSLRVIGVGAVSPE